MKRTNRTSRNVTLVALLSMALVVPAAAQEGSFTDTAKKARADLDRAVRELAELRAQITDENVPLNRKLNELEQKLIERRADYQDVSREFDTKNLEVSNLTRELENTESQAKYLQSLFDEYVRNFETRVHIAELQRYRNVIETARNAPEQPDLSDAQKFEAQAAMIDITLDRLVNVLGGDVFEGQALDSDSVVKNVKFAIVGPVAVYATEDGSDAGLAEQALGSLEPNMAPVPDAAQTEGARNLVAQGRGLLPFDPTQGNARKIEETRDTLAEHIAKGGPVMIPILLLATTALLVAVIKWVQLARVREPSAKSIQALLKALKARDYAEVNRAAQDIRGPSGEMLRAGVEQIREPKDLVEEVMFEQMLETRLKLQSFLSFVAVSAAAAPLLGLLGTVTGIINTFKLITVYGTGDAKTLSGGISEALITTEFGLIVAIPSLLLHAFLSRKAKRLVDHMEKTAVSFLNRIPSAPSAHEGTDPTTSGKGAAGGRSAAPMPDLNRPLPAEGPDH